MTPRRMTGTIPHLFSWGLTHSVRVWKTAWRHKRGYQEAVQREAVLDLMDALFSHDPEVHKKHGFTVIARSDGSKEHP